MKIYLVQHGEAKPETEDPDHDQNKAHTFKK